MKWKQKINSTEFKARQKKASSSSWIKENLKMNWEYKIFLNFLFFLCSSIFIKTNFLDET